MPGIRAAVALEVIIGSDVWRSYDLEERVEVSWSVAEGSPCETPAMLSRKSIDCPEFFGLGIANEMSFVNDDSKELHAVEGT